MKSYVHMYICVHIYNMYIYIYMYIYIRNDITELHHGIRLRNDITELHYQMILRPQQRQHLGKATAPEASDQFTRILSFQRFVLAIALS